MFSELLGCVWFVQASISGLKETLENIAIRAFIFCETQSHISRCHFQFSFSLTA